MGAVVGKVAEVASLHSVHLFHPASAVAFGNLIDMIRVLPHDLFGKLHQFFTPLRRPSSSTPQLIRSLRLVLQVRCLSSGSFVQS